MSASSKHDRLFVDRRRFLTTTAAGVAFFQTKGLFAEELSRTPAQTEGPFYPDRLPLDTDNDLLRINDTTTPAIGIVTHFGGRVLTRSGSPVRNAVVEIWQADANGNYIHSRGEGRGKARDTNFQGFGRFTTGTTGEYYFRTIRPVPYFPRTPHIHIAVELKGKRVLTTQCYIEGEPMNARDGILQRTGNLERQKLLLATFKPLPGSQTGEQIASFDIVLGETPNENG